jgi:serine phosphatase RsbU (regulator of sigma subunit)
MSLLRFITFSLFVLSFGLKAQNIDSLRKRLSTQKDTMLFKAYLSIGNALYEKGQLDSSVCYLNDGLKIAKKAGDQKFTAALLIKLGLMQREKGIYNKSSEFYYQALEIADRNKNENQKAACYNGIAVLSSLQKDYEKAIEYYNKGLAIYTKNNNISGQASIANNMGLIYLDQSKHSIALKFFLKALELNKKAQNDFGLAAASENIGLIYDEFSNYKLASLYFGKALAIWHARNDDNSIAINLGYIGNSLIKQQRWQTSIDTLLRAVYFADKANSQSAKRDIFNYLSTSYEALKVHEKALYYYKRTRGLADSVENNENTKEITEIQLNYAFNKIKIQDSVKHQLEVSSKEAQLRAEKNYKYIISSVCVIVSILLFIAFKNYKEKTKANKVITFQKDLVEKKQKEIFDSLTYARRIQTALLTQDQVINSCVRDHFNVFLPKDIVSGDFYWVTKKDHLLYFAVCDSTGHGVPGAFMSLLNINFLNEAVNEKGFSKPNEIFNYVRQQLIDSISKEGQQDGFDGVLLCINTLTKKITYAAANNKPLLVTSAEAKQLETDKMPVGKSVKDGLFRLFSLTIGTAETLYLYTDGYADQFGGPKGKKFKVNELIKLLQSIGHLSMQEQKHMLKKHFDLWKGELEQVDDVLLFGIKI